MRLGSAPTIENARVDTGHLSACPFLPVERRRLLALTGAGLALRALGGCAVGVADVAAWQARLRDDTVALLGEVHDNAELHRFRAAALRHACAAGWRPAIVMEQFDLDRQDDLERSRRERPRDPKHLIGRASDAPSGWSWPDYEPVIALALDHDLPLLAGNLPRAQAARIVREGYASVFGAARVQELGLADPPAPPWQAAQEREIDAGHCGALPRAMLPGMARAQFARDALMAQVLRENAAHGAVLLAGNGHVRRDLGVPRWLGAVAPARLLVVGFVEAGDAAVAGAFDAIVSGAPALRKDPCSEFVTQ